MPKNLFKQGNQASKATKGIPRPGSGRTPEWLKEKCKDILDKKKLVEFLGDIAEDKKVETRDRLRAIEMLLDRAFGKPDAHLQVEGNINLFDILEADKRGNAARGN